MGYLSKEERDKRLDKVRKIMAEKELDICLVYYDEFNIGNGWYLTGWCPQFESGAVLVPGKGEPMILGGPESEPFAKLDSAITETRNFPVFMVPDEEYPNATIIDFPKLFTELNSKTGKVKRAGLVGAGRMPADCHRQISEGFTGVKLIDITREFVELRYLKSAWELARIRESFKLADFCYDAMKQKIAAGVSEIEIAAAGEYAARSRGASGFGFTAIVGSGKRGNAVVPTASAKKLTDGEMVMVGLAPKVQGYAGVVGDTLPVSGSCTAKQKECVKHLKEAFRLTKEQLAAGRTGREIDAPARAYFKEHDLTRYLVCPFAHTIGLHEAESPFFGPNSDDVLKPGMAVCVDISFFGHPEFNGARIETGYEITEKGAVPFSPKMDQLLSK
ncbi:MAG: Xaa-Pro peptidase family protein [Candidatus Ratteibacteria bacterium]|jgi:Xaa-Pro aminopeptidase